MKVCSKCEVKKEDSNFTSSQLKNKNSKCKDCISIYNKKWYQNNTEKVMAKSKKWQKENPEKVKKINEKWYQNNTEKAIEKSKKWQKENPEKIKEIDKKWAKNNPEKIAAKNKKYYQNNAEKIKARNKKWQQENREKLNAKQRERYQNDPIFRNRCLASAMVNRMLQAQGSSKKGKSSLDYFPWTPEELWVHLLKYMKEPGNEWMHKDNQGIYNPKTHHLPEKRTWQLDHIIPHSDCPYDSLDRPNLKKVWSLSNLRPLDSKQNLMDGANRTRHVQKK